MFDPAEQAEAEDEARLRGVRGWTTTRPDLGRHLPAGDHRRHPNLDPLPRPVGRDRARPSRPGAARDAQPTLDHRKVAALGIIADGAGATTRTTAYLHIDLTDLPEPLVRMGKVEKLGPLTIAKIREWLGTSRFTLQPVLDLARADAVDQHDPPAWMRELVVLRDRTCVHPYCDKPSRDCDLDHIDAYVEMDDGGPPGQTRPGNLAPLCRRHHRAKTHYGWSYRRNRDGTYTWASPRGRRYTVDARGVVTRGH